MSKKRKANKINNIALLGVGIVCLLGLLISFMVRGNEDNENINRDNGKDVVKEQNETEDEKDLEEVPKVEEGIGPLTGEEVALVKKAIETDKEGYFKVVNKKNTVEENFEPGNLVIPDVGITKDRSNEQNFVREDIADDVEAFLGAAKEAGHEIFLSSGYRSYSLQSIFYNNDLQGNGGVETGYVAAPGTSEHHLGLAIDLTSHSVNLGLTDEFENTPEGQWALENAHKYGFILRYDKDKENITGYQYEPWHYRYIGNKEISKLCYEKNITIEELIEYAK